MENSITITVSEEIRNKVQKADLERSSRRDILIYLMQHPEIEVSKQRKQEYQKEYDDKYLAFEQAKLEVEQTYVIPMTEGKFSNWSLDYHTCILTINMTE